MSSEHNSRIDDIVAAVAPRVLDDALEQAVDRAREELTGTLTRAIVDRVLLDEAAADVAPATPQAEPSTTPAPPPAEAPTAQRAASGTGLYAFAIVPAGPVDLAGVPGIDGEAALRVVQLQDLGLVVSRMRLDLLDDVSEEDLSESGALATLARRHDEVVRRVFDHGPVLPLRFGTVVADEEGARRLLQEQAAAARRRLEHLSTHREWGVRLSRGTGTADTEAGSSADSQRRGHSGTSYLAARRAALQRAERAEQETTALTRRVQDTLDEHSADRAHRGGGPGSGLLADVAYLVPLDAEEAFLAAAERLDTEVAHEDLVLEVTGPWPPYSFATLGTADAPKGVAGSA